MKTWLSSNWETLQFSYPNPVHSGNRYDLTQSSLWTKNCVLIDPFPIKIVFNNNNYQNIYLCFYPLYTINHCMTQSRRKFLALRYLRTLSLYTSFCCRKIWHKVCFIRVKFCKVKEWKYESKRRKNDATFRRAYSTISQWIMISNHYGT